MCKQQKGGTVHPAMEGPHLDVPEQSAWTPRAEPSCGGNRMPFRDDWTPLAHETYIGGSQRGAGVQAGFLAFGKGVAKDEPWEEARCGRRAHFTSQQASSSALQVGIRR